MEYKQLCDLIQDTMKLSNIVLGENTRLLGYLPEFDSLSLITLLTKLEKNYGINIEKNELNSEIFATVGHLWQFLQNKKTAPKHI